MPKHEEPDLESGANKAQELISKGASAGRTIGKLASHSGPMKLFFLPGGKTGMAVMAAVIIVLFIIIVMTTSLSYLTSTQQTIDNSKKFITQQLKNPYKKAVRNSSQQVKGFITDGYDEGGYNCGDYIGFIGVDFVFDSEPDYPNVNNEDENFVQFDTTKFGDFFKNRQNGIKIEGYTGESEPEGREPWTGTEVPEKYKKYKASCKVKMHFAPTLPEHAEIITAFVEAKNGVIENMPEASYEEAEVITDVNQAISKPNGKKVDENGNETLPEDVQFEEFFGKDKEKSNDKYEQFLNKYGTKYDSISSTEFQSDFKAFTEPGFTAYYKYKNETRSLNYSDNVVPIFTTVYNHGMYMQEDRVEVKFKYESEEHVYADYSDAQNKMSPQTGGQPGTIDTPPSDSTREDDPELVAECGDWDGCETFTEYTWYAYPYYEIEFKREGELDPIPIFFDMSEYRKREFDNLTEAFVKGGDPTDVASEYLADAFNANYDNELKFRGVYDKAEMLKEKEAEVRERFVKTLEEYETIMLSELPDTNGNGGLLNPENKPYSGTSYQAFMTISAPHEGGVAPMKNGRFDWGAYASHAEVSNPFAVIDVNAYNAVNNYIAQLRREGVSMPGYTCYVFASAWCYDHHGIAFPGAGISANTIANYLIKNHGFTDGTGNGTSGYVAPGAIVSVTEGLYGQHVFCVDATEWRGNELYVTITDGNVLGGARMAVTMKWTSLFTPVGTYQRVVIANPPGT